MRLADTVMTWMTWRVGYMLALWVCGLFFVASFSTYSMGTVTPLTSGLIAAAFGIFIVVAAMVMIISGGALAALPYFLIGASVFFGFGTYISVIDVFSNKYMTGDEQTRMLPQINAINSLAIFIVVAFAGIFGAHRPVAQTPGRALDWGLRQVLESLQTFMPSVLLLGFAVHGLEWMTFPKTQDNALASALSFLAILPMFAIFAGGATWSISTRPQRALVVTLIILSVVYGALSFSKMAVILPILGLGLGLWVAGDRRLLGTGVLLLAIASYFAVLLTLVNEGRVHALYDPEHNTVGQRLHIAQEVLTSIADGTVDPGERASQVTRLSITQYSAHFIASYDNSFPGDSMDSAFMALIPRFLWPNKPIINPGQDFDTAWRGIELLSSLAIGFPAEAYWNAGWGSVVGMSAFIGLMLGWFTRKWFLFLRDGWPQFGVFVCGALLVKSALWVETSIVVGYVGGWTKLAIVILVIDFIARAVQSLRNRDGASDAPRGNMYALRDGRYPPVPSAQY